MVWNREMGGIAREGQAEKNKVDGKIERGTIHIKYISCKIT